MKREDLPLVGVFSTRSPARPNPVLATVARLVQRRGNVLRVRGLDAVDGSPVVDIKPLTSGSVDVGEIREAEWVKQLTADASHKS